MPRLLPYVSSGWRADERFRGSILVAPRAGKEAAAEARRLANDPRLAQIVLAFPPALLGDRSLYPLFEAAQDARLPVSLQAGG
jgi:predicted TIM-barrel fold metal-dependent hydrolase